MNTAHFLRANARWLSAGALLTFLSSFGQTFFVSLFSEHIRADFALSHGDWGLLYSIGTGAAAAVMVWAGGLTDHYKTRWLGAWVLVGLAVACLIMAVNRSAWVLVAVVFLLRLFGQGMASHTAVVAMARWFVAARGRALAVCTLGFTFGEAMFPIPIVALLGVFDWRILWVCAAFVSLAGIPYLIWALAKERNPQQVAQDMDSAGMNDRHWIRAEVLRHPLFWLMVPSVLGPSAFNTAFFFHHPHYAELKGMTQLALVSFFPIYTVVAVAAMVVSGWLVDRFGSARTIPLYQVPMIFAFVLFSIGSGIWIVVGLVFLAFTSGANSTLPNVFWAEFFGSRFIGSIKAMAAAVMVLGSAIGPFITGQLIDASVGLERQYFSVAGFFALSTICMTMGIFRYRGDVPVYRALRR